MKKLILSGSFLMYLATACASSGTVSKTSTSEAKPNTDNAEAIFVLDEEDQTDDFQRITDAYQVANVDSTVFAKQVLLKTVNEINTFMGETGSAYATEKGIVVTFERGDLFGLAGYVPSNNAQTDFKKLIKALNRFKGTVIIAGQTDLSGSTSSKMTPHERALRVARFISKSDISKERILLDDTGVCFYNASARNARVSNKDRVIEFLLVPKKS